MDASVRRNRILEIIKNKRISSQTELAFELAADGFSCTQATVSRDIKELGLIKVTDEGGFHYETLKSAEPKLSSKSMSLFRDAIGDIIPVSNTVVLKTVDGGAAVVEAALLLLKPAEMICCVTGRDAVLLVCEDADKAYDLTDRLTQLIRFNTNA